MWICEYSLVLDRLVLRRADESVPSAIQRFETKREAEQYIRAHRAPRVKLADNFNDELLD
jgi:hypothetical protein